MKKMTIERVKIDQEQITSLTIIIIFFLGGDIFYPD